MIETARLIIADRQSLDVLTENAYSARYPELNELDPAVGEFKNVLYYSIHAKMNNEHIGSCCLYNFTNSECELGIRIFNPAYWNKGYGTEVVNALCGYVFAASSAIMAVLAKATAHNIRAIRCYEKCGFIKRSEGYLDGHYMVFMVRGAQ